MRRGSRSWLALFVVTAMVAGACGGAEQPRQQGQAAQAPEGAPLSKKQVADVVRVLNQQVEFTGVVYRGAVDVSGLSSVALTAGDVGAEEVFFDPTVLVGEPGQEITLVVANEGDLPHTFTLVDESIDVDLARGRTAQVDVTLPSGDEPVLFYCDLHEVGGQWGALATG